MTHQEFVFWLKGYLEGIGGLPTEDHMKVINEKLVRTQPVVSSGISIPWISTNTVPNPPYKVTCSDYSVGSPQAVTAAYPFDYGKK